MGKENYIQTYGRYDVCFEKGNRCKLYDDKGNEYIDFVSGVAVNCLGHANPAIVKTINEQAQKVMQISNYYYNSKNIDLAEKLCKLSDHDMAFFCNSGTEAIEAGLKLARKYGRVKKGPEKCEIIYMENSFHGRTMGALSVTGREKYRKNFRPLIEGVKSVKFNDTENIKNTINENTCAVILEPIQGEGGLISADRQYLKNVRQLCDKFDALLIFDEVQCGIGRTGSIFAYKKFGTIPDVVCMAKGLGGGFPIGAIIATKKAGNAFEMGDHGTTFGGNPLASAVALTVLHELADNGIVDAIDEKSNYFIGRLNELIKKYPDKLLEVKGMGLLLGVKVKIDPRRVMDKCFSNKLLVISAGADVIRFLPPLNVKKNEIDEALEIFDKSIGEM